MQHEGARTETNSFITRKMCRIGAIVDLTYPGVIEVYVPSMESEWSCIYVVGLTECASVSTNLIGFWKCFDCIECVGFFLFFHFFLYFRFTLLAINISFPKHMYGIKGILQSIEQLS